MKRLAQAICISLALAACDGPGAYDRFGTLLSPDLKGQVKYVAMVGGEAATAAARRAMVQKGYAVLPVDPDIVLRTYQVDRYDVLVVGCGNLRWKSRGLGEAATAECEIIDLATGDTVYVGSGEYLGWTFTDDVNGAVREALRAFPAADGSGGAATASLDLPRLDERRPRQGADRQIASTGSGFFVSRDGHIVTNAHVVEECRKVLVRYKGRNLRAAVKDVRQGDDLALLVVQTRPPRLAPIVPGSTVRRAASIVAVGFPLPDILASGLNVTLGNVSALSGLGGDSRLLQITAPVQPGNSGGPLFDAQGRVVGVVVAKLDAAQVFADTGDIPQNINYAIKADMVLHLLKDHGIPAPASAPTAPMSPEEVADIGRDIAVFIICEL
ncbi:MAG: S1C family serine protease [Inquilinaceae bacterium]